MGIYYIPCNTCGKTFAWFSGNPLEQNCEKCSGPQPNKNKTQVFKLHPDAKLPTRNLPNDAGADLYALEDTFIKVGSTVKVPTGIAINIPTGCVGYVMRRSSMAVKGLESGVGVVDAGYSGDCSVVLHNVNNKQNHDIVCNEGYLIKKGDKIAQLVVQKCFIGDIEEVTELWQSERGNKGFGSSGK